METESIHLRKYIRTISDWPKKGILFRDITPLLADGPAFAAAVEALCAGFTASGVHPVRNEVRKVFGSKSRISNGVDYVAAVEARGFIFGAAAARRLGVGFVPIRKQGKLPFKTESVTYNLEYGTDTLQVHSDAVAKGAKVLMIDDLLATGGTMAAACKLMEKIGATIAAISFLIELTDLLGREKLAPYKINSVIAY